MNNCIFTAHCTEPVCDKSCPILSETSYLLERNGLSFDNAVFQSSTKDINNALYALHKSDGKLATVVSDDTIGSSNLLTYCAICENWQGNRLHCNVYHLKFSNHVESIQRSWSAKNTSDSLEYEQIWSSSAKILIISNIDYVQFKDFQSQTLLNLIHNRMNSNLTTIVVSPNLSSLIGNGVFFNKLVKILDKAVIKW